MFGQGRTGAWTPIYRRPSSRWSRGWLLEQPMCAKLCYRCLDLPKNLCRVLFHLPGVCRRVLLHVHSLDKDGNKGLELVAVNHLKGEKSGKWNGDQQQKKNENSVDWSCLGEGGIDGLLMWSFLASLLFFNLDCFSTSSSFRRSSQAFEWALF